MRSCQVAKRTCPNKLALGANSNMKGSRVITPKNHNNSINIESFTEKLNMNRVWRQRGNKGRGSFCSKLHQDDSCELGALPVLSRQR